VAFFSSIHECGDRCALTGVSVNNALLRDESLCALRGPWLIVALGRATGATGRQKASIHGNLHQAVVNISH